MSGDTSLGYVVANKFSMDPKKRQQIFAKCKKDDENLEKRKKEILEKYADKQDKSRSRKNDSKSSKNYKGKAKSKEFQKKLQTKIRKKYGKYAKNWRFKKNSKGSFVIYNADPTYRLTHLLEHGHVLRNGGRSKAIPHIKPVEEKIKEKFEQRIKNIGK